MPDDHNVTAHYSGGHLLERLNAALRDDGVDPFRPDIEALAPYDQFHGRGVEATQEMADSLAIAATDHILDVGSGIGGSARYLARRFGCRVTGIDLTPEFCEVARHLTRLLRMDDNVEFHLGNALAMPFGDATFDGAYSMNVSMNIADKAGLYREIRRVLKPGAWLVLSEIAKGPGPEVEYPTPWARTAQASFLATLEDTLSALDAAGFEVTHHRETREQALAFGARSRALVQQGQKPPHRAIQLIHGGIAQQAMANTARALAEQRVVPIEILARKRLKLDHEIVIIGAGAAGLAAASELGRAHRQVLILEARERVGGRCWTRQMPGVSAPIELGAEFIHGRPEITLRLLKRAGIAAIDSVRASRYVDRDRLVPIDAFAVAQRAVRGAVLRKDLSFESFLARRRLATRTRTFARLMVQGFDAADPARVSVRSIIEEWGSGTSMGASQPRPASGYGPLLETLATEALGDGVQIRSQAVVHEIRWRAGAVEIEGKFLGRRFVERAHRAIVTLPLGVLQSGAVRFSPALRGKRAALRQVASGPVIKAALRFEHPFWEERSPGTAFFHAPRSAFPTFWTPLPARVPLLIAWAGGPKAERLAHLSEESLIEQALRGVRTVFGRVPALAAALVHDWRRDPFARGAYSYLRVGGEGARETLSEPLADTLFFAGEATDTAGEAGTVAGALQSGVRAARQLLEVT